jgi:hypothetical protein
MEQLQIVFSLVARQVQKGQGLVFWIELPNSGINVDGVHNLTAAFGKFSIDDPREQEDVEMTDAPSYPGGGGEN